MSVDIKVGIEGEATINVEDEESGIVDDVTVDDVDNEGLEDATEELLDVGNKRTVDTVIDKLVVGVTRTLLEMLEYVSSCTPEMELVVVSTLKISCKDIVELMLSDSIKPKLEVELVSGLERVLNWLDTEFDVETEILERLLEVEEGLGTVSPTPVKSEYPMVEIGNDKVLEVLKEFELEEGEDVIGKKRVVDWTSDRTDRDPSSTVI